MKVESPVKINKSGRHVNYKKFFKSPIMENLVTPIKEN